MRARGLCLRVRTAGFTLVEMIIVAGIGLIVGAFLVSILVNNNGLFYKQNSIVTEGLSVDDIAREIDLYVRQSVQIATGYPEISPDFVTGSEVLVLKLPAIGSQGIIENTFDFVIVTKDNANPKILKIIISPDVQSTRQPVNKIMTTILNSLTFTYLDKNNLVVTPVSATKLKTDLEVLSKTGAVGSPKSTTTITSLRNL